MSCNNSISYSEITEDIVAGGLAEVPYVGHIASDLVETLWPGADNQVWQDVACQTAELIGEELDTTVYNTVMSNLDGLRAVTNDYLDALKTAKNAQQISDNWTSALYAFDEQLPNFQTQNYELLLLPLFAQAVNLYLALLRDGIQFGISWGWTADYKNSVAQDMSAAISNYVNHAQTFFQQGVNAVVASTKANDHECEPFKSVNTYVRQMTLMVADYGQMWEYMNPSAFPEQIAVHLNREIYSDPVGTCDNSGNIVLPSRPLKPPLSITVWAWDRIDAVQLTYGSGMGPDGVTTTARMGDSNGGSNQPPHGGIFDVHSNRVVAANGAAGDILNAFNFTFKDGTTSGTLGGNPSTGGSGTPFSFSYPNHILSSIHINGISNYYGSADCAVFGFKYKEPPSTEFPTIEVPYGWTTTT